MINCFKCTGHLRGTSKKGKKLNRNVVANFPERGVGVREIKIGRFFYSKKKNGY